MTTGFSPPPSIGRGVTFLAAVALCGLLGCGPKEYQPQSSPVEGHVRWKDGTDAGELAGGSVEFESSGTVAAKADLISDGTFTLPQPLPAGKYRVRVTPPQGSSELDRRYQKFETSGLSVTSTGESQSVSLEVTRGR